MFAKQAIEPNVIYTREEAAQCLGVSLSTLKQLIRTGQLTVSQPLGMRRVFIKGSSILDMLQQTERGAEPIRSFDGDRLEKNFAPNWHSDETILDSALRARPKSRAAQGKSLARTASKPATASGGANR